MRLQLSFKLILKRNLTACSFSCRDGLISVVQFLALMHEPFYICLLLLCNAVSSSVKMCPQVWITRLKVWPCLCPRTCFLSHLTMFFEQVQCCLCWPSVLTIIRAAAFSCIFVLLNPLYF